MISIDKTIITKTESVKTINYEDGEYYYQILENKKYQKYIKLIIEDETAIATMIIVGDNVSSISKQTLVNSVPKLISDLDYEPELISKEIFESKYNYILDDLKVNI